MNILQLERRIAYEWYSDRLNIVVQKRHPSINSRLNMLNDSYFSHRIESMIEYLWKIPH